jgi:FlaA1/EpsC-like NDP-sugar epimerase
MHGFRVLGKLENAQKIIKKHHITELLIAMPSAPKSTVRKFVDNCSDEKIKFRILPAMADIITGKLTVQHIRDVEVEDLLGREPISLDRSRVLEQMRGKCVLVTGAGGSIGSELARQIAGYNPRHLLMLDMGETPLFEIDREIAELTPNVKRTAIVCDIKNRHAVQSIFQTHAPNLVFHAAAYKHVPLMEDHPSEAVTNNILGTRNLAETAVKYETEKFVMISTDKAVRPTNVMGATKRCAELLVNALNQDSKTAFASVRFGNVLGSNGSVVPIFKKQIKNGLPIKITHPDITRYFMTIPEAVELVLQAETICSKQGGEVFILDMGEPIKIVDLAKNLIKLSGLKEEEDIDIVYTGLRPGEKLYEELIAHGEDVELTDIPKIMVHRRNGKHNNDQMQILEQLTGLVKLAQTQDAEKTRQQLWQTVCQNDPDIPRQNSTSHINSNG